MSRNDKAPSNPISDGKVPAMSKMANSAVRKAAKIKITEGIECNLQKDKILI